MKQQLHHSIIALLALIISAPAMLCVFAPGSFSPVMAHHAGQMAASQDDPHAHHKMQHGDKAPHKMADHEKVEQFKSLACLFHCLDTADNPYLTAAAPEHSLAQQSDEPQLFTLPIHLRSTLPLLAHLNATGPPPDTPRVTTARALLIEKTHRLRL